jgi:hypothetical protein
MTKHKWQGDFFLWRQRSLKLCRIDESHNASGTQEVAAAVTLGWQQIAERQLSTL